MFVRFYRRRMICFFINGKNYTSKSLSRRYDTIVSRQMARHQLHTIGYVNLSIQLRLIKVICFNIETLAVIYNIIFHKDIVTFSKISVSISLIS